MNVLEAIHARRSIRRFTDRDVARADIETILEAAHWAPSAKNSQSWRFTVAQGESLKSLLDVFEAGIQARQAEGVDIGSAPGSLAIMRQAPVAILIHNTEGIHPWKARKEHESWWDTATVQSVGAAIQNLLLSAYEKGLATLWIADIWASYLEVNQWAGTDAQLVSAVSLGYPAMEPRLPGRKPLEDVVIWRN